MSSSEICLLNDLLLFVLWLQFFFIFALSDTEPLLLRYEVEKQLDYIKDEVEILHHVAKECQRLMNEGKKSDYKQGQTAQC